MTVPLFLKENKAVEGRPSDAFFDDLLSSLQKQFENRAPLVTRSRFIEAKF